LIFLRSKPFFSTLSTAVAGSGTAPTLVPFYLRRVSTPSASPSEPPPPHRTPVRAVPFALIPLPARTVSDPPRIQPTPYPLAKRYGSHGGSYGINKSGAHAPQLPSLLPSAATSHPSATSLPRPTTSTPFQPYPLCPCYCSSLYPCPLPSSFVPFLPRAATCTEISLAAAMDFVLSPQPTTLNRANFHLPSPSSLMYPSFLKLRLKLYNEHVLYRVSWHNPLSIFLTFWDML